MNNCDCFTEIDPQFLKDLETETGTPEWHALYTVRLGALIEDGVFNWSRKELDWSSAAYDTEQYERVCAYFIERYRYDEISILPIKEWMLSLKRRLVYELMPKYRIYYAEAAEKYDLGFGGDESGTDKAKSDDYFKERVVRSDYPETLLSGNADYISDGNDAENERLRENESEYAKKRQTGIIDRMKALELYSNAIGTIDRRLLDELEIMFIQLYTANVNGL